MKKTIATPAALLLIVAFVFGGCETATTDHDPVHPRAEQAQQVVDAFATAYADYRGIEKRPVGLAVDSWRNIPDAELAEAMATLPLPHSATRTGLSPAPWTLGFIRNPNAEPGVVLGGIVDRDQPGVAKGLAVAVEPDGAVRLLDGYKLFVSPRYEGEKGSAK